MHQTKIQWCDSTVNPTSGCDGCELWIRGITEVCFAGQIHTRFEGTKAYPGPFEEVNLHPGRMAPYARLSDLTGQSRPGRPWLDGLPRTIFVGDMADVMSRAVPFAYLRDEVIGAIISPRGQRHLWMILTKQPHRLAEFARWYTPEAGPWPTNVLWGTSVTTQAKTTRIDALLEVPGQRFVSAEPLWGPIDVRLSGIDLVIAGGESAARGKSWQDAKPCDLAWLRSLRDQCRRSGVPFFLKQLGSNPQGPDGRLRLRDGHGGDWGEWPDDLRVREMPAAAMPTAPGRHA
jgi:protein gp37